MAPADCIQFHVNCPSRHLFDQIADRWSMMVLTVLDGGPTRFNAIKRQLEGVTQKALTQCLRRLERNGLIERRVVATSPVAVEYEITPLGRTLQAPFKALYAWTVDSLPEVEAARLSFDSRAAGGETAARPGINGASAAGQNPASPLSQTR